MVLEISGFSCS